MTVEKIRKIGVVGAGTMGRGIAQVFALHGYDTLLFDVKKEALDTAKEKIKEHTDPEAWEKIDSIKTTADLNDAADRDLIIEAVFEEVGVKRDVFKALSPICKKSAVIATNTSSISIDELSNFVDRPERFIGMHFMNPPKVMRLIEIIKGERTSGDTVALVRDVSKDIEKVPAVVMDSPGFVSNRLLFALIGEAIRLLESGVASKEDIDTVMKYGMNHPMGPIELADFIGLDVCLDIMLYIYGELKSELYLPPSLLESLVGEGKLGRKSGEGFYKYSH